MLDKKILAIWFPKIAPSLTREPTVQELAAHLTPMSAHQLMSPISMKPVHSEGAGRPHHLLRDACIQVAVDIVDGVKENANDAFNLSQTTMGTIAAWMTPYT